MFESKAVILIALLHACSEYLTEAKTVDNKLSYDNYAYSSQRQISAYSNQLYGGYSSYKYYSNLAYSDYSSSYYFQNNRALGNSYHPTSTYSYYSSYSFHDQATNQLVWTSVLVYAYTFPITHWGDYRSSGQSSYVYYQTTYGYSSISQSYQSSYQYNQYNYQSSGLSPGQQQNPSDPNVKRDSKIGSIIGLASIAILAIILTLCIVFCCCIKIKNKNGQKILVLRKSVRNCTCCLRESQQPAQSQFSRPQDVQQVDYQVQPGMQAIVIKPDVQVIPLQLMQAQPQQVKIRKRRQVIYAQKMQPQNQFAESPQLQQMSGKTYQEISEEDSFRAADEKL